MHKPLSNNNQVPASNQVAANAPPTGMSNTSGPASGTDTSYHAISTMGKGTY